jgi:hypothetical protein
MRWMLIYPSTSTEFPIGNYFSVLPGCNMISAGCLIDKVQALRRAKYPVIVERIELISINNVLLRGYILI